MQDSISCRVSCGVLLSRQACLAKEELAHFATHGACCYIVQCDVAHSIETNKVMGWVHEHLPIVGKIAHAAGLLGYGSIKDMTTSGFWSVAMPKVMVCIRCRLYKLYEIYIHPSTSCRGGNEAFAGSQVIGSMLMCKMTIPVLTRHLFSSTSSVWSQPGACHYSSANKVVDACAASCR